MAHERFQTLDITTKLIMNSLISDETDELFELIKASGHCHSHNELCDVQSSIENLTTNYPYLLEDEYDGRLPLHDAVAMAPLSVVKMLYKAFPQAIRERNAFGLLPLHIACFSESPDTEATIRFLVRKHPTARAIVTHSKGQVPLHKLGMQDTIVSNAPALLDVLIDGVEAETLLCRDQHGKIPLSYFVRKSTLTASGMISKCPESMKQALRNKIVSYASDLWSRGDMDQLDSLFSAISFDKKTKRRFLNKWPLLSLE